MAYPLPTFWKQHTCKSPAIHSIGFSVFFFFYIFQVKTIIRQPTSTTTSFTKSVAWYSRRYCVCDRPMVSLLNLKPFSSISAICSRWTKIKDETLVVYFLNQSDHNIYLSFSDEIKTMFLKASWKFWNYKYKKYYYYSL